MPSTESTWFAQLAEMREALEKLQFQNTIVPDSEENLILDDDDDYSGTGDSDSVFDEIDGYDIDSYSSDFLDEDGAMGHEGEIYGKDWLTHQCMEYCRKKSGGAMEPEDLISNLLSFLSSNLNNDELQSSLTDILGYEDLDFVGELILHRESIVVSCSTEAKQGGHGNTELPDDIILRLMTKEQREETLRSQDLEHKLKPLGPKFAEPSLDYPHIYRSHAAGNTLSTAGKKYSLPVGTQTEEHEKYSEITIPAAKVGTRGRNEKEVLISEMDELCRNTFRGYKSLNRMQSLLYDVAYRTNENMLICAPTGAVSLYNDIISYKPELMHLLGKNGCRNANYTQRNCSQLYPISIGGA